MKCPHCNGHGINRGPYAPPHQCPDCRGTGEIVCEACGNDEPTVLATCDFCEGRICERCMQYVGEFMLCSACSDLAGVEAVEDRLRSLGAIS